MKVIFNIADTREPVRTYQLEHRSGSRINIVEDGVDDLKYSGTKQGLKKFNNDFAQGASSVNCKIASAIVKVIILLFLLL